MAFTRAGHNEWEAECDFCDEVQTFEGSDFHEAWEAAKDEGWRCWNDEGGWTHCCPGCMEERKEQHRG